MENKNEEGLLTTCWGPSLWHSLHCISFNYPNNPSDIEKKHYKSFFESIQFVLPCNTCRQSYHNFIMNNESTILTDEVFTNRKTLTYWLYNLHNHVNKKTGSSYNLSYDDICKKYNSYIATDIPTINNRILAYKNLYNIEAPTIEYELSKCFVEYAKDRGFNDFLNILDKTKSIDKYSTEWDERNNKCNEIIKHMRLHGILCLEESGEFKGNPTIEELKLLQLMCSTIHNKQLCKIIKKLGFIMKPTFCLVK